MNVRFSPAEHGTDAIGAGFDLAADLWRRAPAVTGGGEAIGRVVEVGGWLVDVAWPVDPQPASARAKAPQI